MSQIILRENFNSTFMWKTAVGPYRSYSNLQMPLRLLNGRLIKLTLWVGFLVLQNHLLYSIFRLIRQQKLCDYLWKVYNQENSARRFQLEFEIGEDNQGDRRFKTIIHGAWIYGWSLHPWFTQQSQLNHFVQFEKFMKPEPKRPIADETSPRIEIFLSNLKSHLLPSLQRGIVMSIKSDFKDRLVLLLLLKKNQVQAI